MAKVVKVTITKTRIPGGSGTKFTWPPIWDAQKGHVVAYEETDQKGAGIREGAIAVVDDAEYDRIKGDPDIELLDEETANTLGRQWRKQRVIISDQQAVIDIITTAGGSLKSAYSGLSEDIKKVLDPNDDTPGITKSKLFDIAKHINAAKAKETE